MFSQLEKYFCLCASTKQSPSYNLQYEIQKRRTVYAYLGSDELHARRKEVDLVVAVRKVEDDRLVAEPLGVHQLHRTVHAHSAVQTGHSVL